MSLSHLSSFSFQFSVFILLAVGLNIKTTMAFEDFENTPIFFYQQETAPPAKKKDKRRRSECGVSPSLWTLNLCETHKFCYLAQKQVKLWEPQHKRSRRTKRLLIKNTRTQQRVELTWRASQETIDWPIEQMPIESGTAYLIQLKKRRVYFEREIYLYQVPNYLKTTRQRVDWMTQQGCAWQVEMVRKK
jgi:hypothetical protein